MVLNKYTGSTQMDGSEDSLFKIVGATMKHFATYVYLKALQAGESIRLRVYNKVDGVSHWKLDGDVTDSVSTNNGTVTNISSFVSQWKFDGNVNDSIGSNNGTITYHANLKALYKFDNTINDSTSGAHNLTLAAGTTTYVTGQEGQAVSFDGSTYYTANSAVIVSGTGDRSVSFWVKTPSTFATEYLFSWGATSTNNLFGAQWSSTASTSTLAFVGFGNDWSTTTVFQPNTWYHLVLTLGSSGTVRNLYINGVLDSNFPRTATALNTTSTSLFIGSTPIPSNLYHGYIDEFRIYSIAVTQAQVSALYMNGKFAQSHTFDNTDNTTNGEFISVNDNASLNPTGGVSISGWFNAQSGTLEQDLVRKDTQYMVRITSNSEATNRLEFFIWTSNGGGTIHDRLTWTFTPNVWNHFCATYNGTTGNWSLYGNGVLQSNQTVTGTKTLNTTTNKLGIGTANPAVISGVYCGQLDEIRFYNAELTASQVLGLYNYTGSNYVTPLPVGNALSLDGSSYVTTTKLPYNFERTQAFSTSCWFKTTTSGGVLLGNASGASSGWEIGMATVGASGTITVLISNTYNTNLLAVTTTSTFNDGNWHNLIVTYSGNSLPSGVTVYVDGVSKTLTTNYNTLSATTVSTFPIVIGNRVNTGGANFTGLIDEVQIYPYVVSSAEINAINAGRFANTHPIGLWHFDGDLYDYSGQGSTGSPTGTMTYVTGALSGSYNVPNTHFNFDGSEYVPVGNSSSLNFNSKDPLSVEFWIRTKNTDAEWIIGKGISGGGGLNWSIGMGIITAGCITFEEFNNVSNYLRVTANSNPINDGLWHQVVVTYTGTSLASGCAIYVDGVSVSLFTNSDTLAFMSILNSSTPIISGRAVDFIAQFVGELDDIRVYTRALSSAEVSDLYTYPDSAMKQLVYDKTYSGVVPDGKYIPMLQGNQYMVTAQQTGGTNRIITWEREEVS